MRTIERSSGFKHEARKTHRTPLDNRLNPVLIALVTDQSLADQFAAGRCNSYSARGWNTYPQVITALDDSYLGNKVGSWNGVQYL